MKKFLLEILIFTAVLFVVLKAIKLMVPYYWGNKQVAQKMEFLKTSNKDFDAFFFGSSKTYRHINPILFESKTGKSAFNLGATGTFTLEVEYLMDNFLHTKKFYDKKDIYVQNITYSFIGKKNLHSVRSNYYLDTKRAFRGINYFTSRKEYTQAYYHLVGFIENQLCIGQVFDIFKYNINGVLPLKGIIAQQNGFYPLDQSLKHSPNNKNLIKRNTDYLKLVEQNKQPIKTNQSKELKLIKLKPIAFGLDDYSNSFNLWLIKNNPISDPKYYFDRGHYNSLGAEKYMEELSEIINKRNKDKK
ncbi:hypothetical protein [Xanthomarina sp. F2636L]|uniref:hypothetical protein n=1 Tax=Xanthomarina sp. F2636L TaxID=2996018 RepID=UPI00225E33B3|nr:hypothetical protein [Xanthomarina sp. F2636L]MCX7551336.1 hypothetical protein [Xanthomarina sp. F2636L]